MAKLTGRRPLGRRLNFVDLAILVMATAVGLVAIRQDLQDLFSRPQNWDEGREFSLFTNPLILIKVVTVEIWLMAWTAGWLVLQLRQPRLPLRQLSRQPGFVACFSTAVVTLVSGPLTWAMIRSIALATNSWLDRVVWGELVSSQIGAAVLAGWALLGLTRRVRIRAGWLDRVGQAMGLFWVAMIPANLFHFFRHSLPDGGWSN